MKKNNYIEKTADGDRIYTVSLSKNKYILTIKEPYEDEPTKQSFKCVDDIAKILSSEYLLLFDDIAGLLNFENKKSSDAEKLEKLQKKYKQLAEKHRRDKQAEYPRKKQELQKIMRLKEIIYNLMNRAYEYIPDGDMAEIENELEKIIKNT